MTSRTGESPVADDPIPLATELAELTPEWLTAALHHDGALGPQGQVVAVATEPVGTGQMADSTRLHLTYTDGPAGPVTVVAKLPAADELSRRTGADMGSYEREVRFYQELAGRVDVRTPHAHHADIEVGTGRFVLILEDLAPARQGDQLGGCSPDVAALAVREVAGLHTARWGDASLEDVSWLHRRDDARLTELAALLPALYGGFAERYGDRLPDDVVALGERFVARVRTWYERPRPWTVVHTDYRLDNLLFGTAEGGPPIAVVDWQTVGLGPGVGDVAYFLGAGLLPDQRRAHEVELLRGWHDLVVASGVAGYAWDRCWRDYRWATLAGLHMAILASMIVERTDRGDAMFVAMAERHGRHALDLDAEELLPPGST